MNKKLDFNDLFVAHGIDEARRQLLAGLLAANDSPSPPLNDSGPWQSQDDQPTPPAPSDFSCRLTLEQCLENYSLTFPDGKIWDERNKTLMKKSVAADLFGKKMFAEWMDHDDRRSIDSSFVAPLAASAAAEGGGGLGKHLQRYVYLYPTADAWDGEKRQIVSMTNLRLAIAKDYDEWLKHPQRRQIDAERLVFDPLQRCDPETHINRFRGLPLTPQRNDDKCRAILRLVWHLCNNKPLEVHWLLCWLAYPLQHVGAKMATAVLMHSPTEGTGKSLFFEGAIKEIYGEYGSTVGQHQLESQYSDWRSGLLYALFEEVLSRDQKFNFTGTLKHMVTGKTQRIEKKFVSGWEEANHMNAVFLSNELQPWPLDDSDRRMFVIWPRTTLPECEQKLIDAELLSGGVEAFYAYLLNYPLKWPDQAMVPMLEDAAAISRAAMDGFLKALPDNSFGLHTKPLMNQEKINLIDFGRPSWEVFFREWLAGELDVPPIPCITKDLFKVYKRWANAGNENVVSLHKFSALAAKVTAVQKRVDVRYRGGQGEKKGRLFIPHDVPDRFLPAGGETDSQWLGRCVDEFQKSMDAGD